MYQKSISNGKELVTDEKERKIYQNLNTTI